MIIFNLVLIIYSFISLLNLKRKDETRKSKLAVINMMFIIYYFIQMAVYIWGNIKMPYGCTMDFRYVVPTVFIGMFFIAQSFERKNKFNIKDIYKAVTIFSILAIVFELTYLDNFFI